jgi:membrane protein DedA with SNARE-associated domain
VSHHLAAAAADQTVLTGGDLMAGAFLSAMNDHTALVVFIIVLVAQLGVPIPTFPVLISAGALATGRMSFMTTFAAAAASSVMADSIWFTTGRIYRLRLARGPRRIGVLEWPVASIERGFDRWGGRLLIVVKLVPGLSMIAIPVAGALRMDWRRFILFSSMGGMLWASIGLTVGFMLSAKLPRIVTLHSKSWMVGALFLGAAIGSCAVYVWVLQHVRAFRELCPRDSFYGVALPSSTLNTEPADAAPPESVAP